MSDRNSEVATKLQKVNAMIIESHFVYFSDMHGSVHVDRDAMYSHTGLTYDLGLAIAEKVFDLKVETVVASEGAAILANQVAACLTRLYGWEVFVIQTVQPDSLNDATLKLVGDHRRFIAGKRVLLVDDVLEDSCRARLAIEKIRSFGGHVVGLGVVCNEGVTFEIHGVPDDLLHFVTLISVDTFDEDKCPMCKKEGVPINTEVGRGREFVARMVKSKTRKFERHD